MLFGLHISYSRSHNLPIHIIDIVGYSKQVTLYYTRLAGVVTGEAFLFLASVTTLFLKSVCYIYLLISLQPTVSLICINADEIRLVRCEVADVLILSLIHI